ncbi:MAG: alcohol dehydrogenase catalytic domain-containing protein [Gaiellales bacterium]
MRAVEIGVDRLLRVVERPAPAPGEGQVVVDVAFCGICRSDLRFREIPALFPDGAVPGTSFQVGFRRWGVGDRVCVLPLAQCGRCRCVPRSRRPLARSISSAWVAAARC